MTRRKKLIHEVDEEVLETAPEIVDPRKSLDLDETELIVENCTMLNMRSRPLAEAKVVLILKKGTRVTLVDYHGEWAVIKTKDTPPVHGFARKYFLRPV